MDARAGLPWQREVPAQQRREWADSVDQVRRRLPELRRQGWRVEQVVVVGERCEVVLERHLT